MVHDIYWYSLEALVNLAENYIWLSVNVQTFLCQKRTLIEHSFHAFGVLKHRLPVIKVKVMDRTDFNVTFFV